uniref:Uncharacterized protein n=1 Tax=Rhizophora mucronata TaxID=61149 RepID=A0A2P2ILB4_RHIMU
MMHTCDICCYVYFVLKVSAPELRHNCIVIFFAMVN